MIKLIKTAAMLCSTFLLIACGGGGGGSGNNVQAETSFITSISPSSGSLLPSMVEARLSQDGSRYVVIAGWIATSPSGSASPDAPIKILKLNSDGQASDVTATFLGSSPLASTNIPVVADFNNDGVDDIFLAGFKDYPVYSSSSILYLSQITGPHKRINLPDLVWSHGAYAIDLGKVCITPATARVDA